MTTSSIESAEKKVAISIKEMAGSCGLSRQRFGQLVKSGVFPSPHRDKPSGRPYYPPELQQICLDVRRRHQGVNGKVVMFYSVRHLASSKVVRPKPVKPKVQTPDRHIDILDGLEGLGLVVTASQVDETLAHLYPDGINGREPGEVLRSVFLHLRSKNSVEKVGG